MKRGFDLSDCMTGSDFENWVAYLLEVCNFEVKHTGNNDNGVDLIAIKNTGAKKPIYYIQCKFYNRTLGKAPIQEVFTGCHYFGDDGYPAVITNNYMTGQAKAYANKLGVEVITKIELNTLLLSMKQRKALNNQYNGLLGLMISTACNDETYFRKVVKNLGNNVTEKSLTAKEQLRQEVIDNFDQADILMQESIELQHKAMELQRQANYLQKQTMLRNLDYG